MKEIIFYWSYLAFPFLAIIIFWKKVSWFKKFFFIILSIIFIYSRFIEPQIITIQETKINLWFNTKIALISDIHMWIYKKTGFLKRLVNKLNSIDADYIFIAWDLTFYPEKEDLEGLFWPLKNLNKPTYWVLWNHDVEHPGPKIRDELKKLFDKSWLILLNNHEIDLWDYKLIWLWSHWNNEDDINILNKYSDKDNIIVLTHNPDTTSRYTNKNVDLTLCWHTHWWQMKIPFLYKRIIPTVWDFDEWLTKEENTLLYITSWVWEAKLPMRLFNPPVIDIINIY